MAGDEIAERLARLERRLEWLQVELQEVRALAAVEATQVTAAPAAPSSAPGDPRLAEAWQALELGRVSDAVSAAYTALTAASASGDVALLDELVRFARSALPVAGPATMRVEQLGLRAERERKALAGAAPELRVAAPSETAPVAPPAAPPEPAGPGAVERAAKWVQSELTGPRAFAIAGGAVLVLGVIFFFVLAANRGWVGPRARVALGTIASVAAVAAGVALRVWYGRVAAAFAAVGAGIAGAYATLAAATVIYSFLPSWAAVLVAAGIAAVGAALAIAWSSQILAGLALVGAAAAPALIALDDKPSWPGTAFALLVLVAAIVVASPRRWLWLDAVVAVVSGVQVVWLAAAASDNNTGAVAIGCAAALVFLAAAIAWQAYGSELDAPATSFALAGGAFALYDPRIVLTDDRRTGVVLAVLAVVFGAAAFGAGRRWRELGWTIGAVALLLGGVAVAFLVSGRSLTIVWAIEAAVLAALARRLGTLRFEAAALAYLGAAAVHSVALEVAPHWPSSVYDVPRGSAAGLFVLAASSLAVGLLQPESPAVSPSSGIAAALDPFWAALARARIEIRLLLASAGAIVLVAGLAAVLSGRWLTIAVAGLAVVAGVAAFVFGERRLQPFALGFLAFAAGHAVAVEVPLRTLVPLPDTDVTTPVPSLAALAVAALVLSLLAVFSDRGIAWLGAPEGPELDFAVLARQAGKIRPALAIVAATAACWGLGLVATNASYDTGLVVSTALWSLLGVVIVVLAARAGSNLFEAVGFVFVLLALLNAAAFDWRQLGDGGAAASLLCVSATLLVAGFAARWLNPDDPSPVEVVALCAGGLGAATALVAFGRLFGYDSRTLGVAALGIAVLFVLVGLAPYLRLRAGGAEPWLRVLANGYWAIALVALLFAERELARSAGGTMALWAATAGVLALAWSPLAEERVWMAALGVGTVSAFVTVAVVVVPSRLVHASADPARRLWVLAVVVAAAWAIGLTTPAVVEAASQWILGVAAGLTLYGLSLGVLEIAEHVSGASVKTDFQRGHTALSALWGIGALALYVVGLARDIRQLRVVGLTLLGLALAKLFLYDLSSLSSITRALSFIAVGAILLAAAFFAERLVRPERPA